VSRSACTSPRCAPPSPTLSPHRRGTGYGTFTAVYGLAWLAGGVITGALYDSTTTGLHIFILTTQAAALLVFLPLTAAPRPGSARTAIP
jgi:predicted MFS family arabinose efflux permease